MKFSSVFLKTLAIYIGIGVLLYWFSKKVVEGFSTSMNGVHDVWYINLDRSPHRKTMIEDEIKKLGVTNVQRWPATDGKTLTDNDFNKLNLPAWSRPQFAKNEKNRYGEIGCYLSHKNLLKHLSQQSMPDDAVHLILEDDSVIDKDAASHWNKGIPTLDKDWDMLFLGLLGNTVTDVKNGVGKPSWITGTHAYAVKHSSIPKILDRIDTLSDPIDEMYGRSRDKLNIYAFSPYKVHQRPNNPSTIH
jgi:GR25 family glycosyltransferase involved in LPS biosynthesis